MQILSLLLSNFLIFGHTNAVTNETCEPKDKKLIIMPIDRSDELLKTIGNGTCACIYLGTAFYTLGKLLESGEKNKKGSADLNHTFNQSINVISMIALIYLAHNKWHESLISLKKFLGGPTYRDQPSLNS